MANFGDRYELIRRIGSGGMGEVWLAHDEQLADRPVAIKIMRQHMLPDAGGMARFEREMRLAAMMGHPNIVTVYTTGTYDGVPFMVMEYLRGRDLQKATPAGGADYAAAAMRGDPIPELRDISGAPAGLSAAVMAMLAHAPASRPAASDCLRLLSSVQSPLPVSGRAGGPGHNPATVPLPPAAPVHAAARRSRRPGRVIAAAARVLRLQVIF